jgi:aryl-alcohol dehydrogenase-like predicted oxidoreductase
MLDTQKHIGTFYAAKQGYTEGVMEKRQLGKTDLEVSLICLGTMTWGQQNTQDEGFEQMDYAVENGVNFFDTAELYAIPPTAETCGKTEEVIGNWFASRKCRDKIILATKIAGPGAHLSWIRNGERRYNREHITAAIEGSLKRLQTDYIDLYQLHWPEREVNSFGKLDFPDAAEIREDEEYRMLGTLQILEEYIDKGVIRHIGLSNETPWGVMGFLQLAEKHSLSRVVSVQNPYNLLNRSFEVGLSEIALQEKCGLLAYSPLAGGALTGKYLNGAVPKGSRRDIDPRGSRYQKPHAESTITRYVEIAKEAGLDPAQMALAFVNSRRFLTANIIGATTMEQLKTNIASADLTLTDDVITAIEAVHSDVPNPCP